MCAYADNMGCLGARPRKIHGVSRRDRGENNNYVHKTAIRIRRAQTARTNACSRRSLEGKVPLFDHTRQTQAKGCQCRKQRPRARSQTQTRPILRKKMQTAQDDWYLLYAFSDSACRWSYSSLSAGILCLKACPPKGAHHFRERVVVVPAFRRVLPPLAHPSFYAPSFHRAFLVARLALRSTRLGSTLLLVPGSPPGSCYLSRNRLPSLLRSASTP